MAIVAHIVPLAALTGAGSDARQDEHRSALMTLRALASNARVLRTGMFGLAVLGYTVLRLPSFFEPHWYTDEAGYATTAREMLRGKILYADIWNNKPPLHLWTVAAALRLFGSGEAGFHLVSYLFGLLTLGAAAYAAFRLLTPVRAIVALAIVTVLLGTPVLDAELLLPESLLIAPAAWAGSLLLVRQYGDRPDHRRRWSLVVGVLAGLAVAYQQTALADSAAFLLILLLSPQARASDSLLYVAGFTSTTALWLVPSMALAGASNVTYALVYFYIPYTSANWSHAPGLVALLAGAMLLAALLAGAGALTGRRGSPTAAVGLWSVATLLAAAAPQHQYPHLLLPAVVPTALLAASLRLPSTLRLKAGLRGRLTAVSMALAVLIATGLAAVTGFDWIPQPYSHSAPGHNLAYYYGGLAGVATGQGSLVAWRRGFDERVGSDYAVARWLRANGLNRSTAVIWSSDAWLYLLADLDEVMPTPPIYNNFALLGQNGEVTKYVHDQRPEVIVTADTETSAFPEIFPLLRQDYVQVFSAGLDHVWVLVEEQSTPNPDASQPEEVPSPRSQVRS